MPIAPRTYRPPHARTERQRQQYRQRDLRAGFRGRNRQEAKRRVYGEDDGCCRGCGAVVTLGESHLDHIQPLSQGGTNEDENLQTLCMECSKRKTVAEQRPRGDRVS